MNRPKNVTAGAEARKVSAATPAAEIPPAVTPSSGVVDAFPAKATS